MRHGTMPATHITSYFDLLKSTLARMLEPCGFGNGYSSPLAFKIAQTLYFPIKTVLLSSVTKSVPEKVYTENDKIATFFTPLLHLNHFPVV